jgi:hypothetical protein
VIPQNGAVGAKVSVITNWCPWLKAMVGMNFVK